MSDEEGIELPSVEAAKHEAVQCARELLANAIRAGQPTVPSALILADECGDTLEVVSLASLIPEPLRR